LQLGAALGAEPLIAGHRRSALRAESGARSSRINRAHRGSLPSSTKARSTYLLADHADTFLRSMTLEPGIEGTHEFEVEGRLLTNVGGTLGFSVLSTPGMIAMMERTAAMLVYPLLPEGKATVGFEVCVKHVAAASEGSRCTARARLAEVVEERKLRFDVEVVSDDQRMIGVGTHERRMIDANR
jgi:predicted thioesterase